MTALLGVGASAMLIFSCSTTKVLQDGEYRLAKNEVIVTNNPGFRPDDLSSYIRQQPNTYMLFGWNPFLNVYNWSEREGNSLSDKFFRKIGVAPVVYDPSQVDESVQNIATHLRYLGYYGSAINSKISVNKRNVTVTYSVTLGNRYPISDIRYSVPAKGEFARDFYSDTSHVTIRRGSFLSESALESESERFSQYMRNKGYFGFTRNYFFYEADTLTDPSKAALLTTVNEYTRNESATNARPLRRYYINNVTISHPSSMKFRENVLTNLNLITPGSLYNENDVNKTYSRLSQIKVFNSVNIQMTPVDTNLVDCNISLTPSPLQGFKANLEASSNSTGLIGISPQLTYYHKNIFRGGEWLNLSFMGNFQFKPNTTTSSTELGTSLSLSIPKFVGLPYDRFKGSSIPRTEFTASYNYQNRPEYTRNIISASVDYNGNVRNRFFYQVYPLQMNIVKLFDMKSSFLSTLENDPFMKNAYQDHFDAGAGMNLYFTTNSDVIPKSTYHYFRLQLDASGNIISLLNSAMNTNENGHRTIWGTPYSQYVRSELTMGKTWRFGQNDGQAFATRLLAGYGYAYGNSSAIPFEKLFYSGGANSLRGWQARTIGPGRSKMNRNFVIPDQTGDMKLEANMEYRFNMFWKVGGALFVDAGNVWMTNDVQDPLAKFSFDTFAESIAADWGLGVRIDLNFILLRLDMGMVFHDPSLDSAKWVGPSGWLKNDGYSVHFGVGYPF